MKQDFPETRTQKVLDSFDVHGIIIGLCRKMYILREIVPKEKPSVFDLSGDFFKNYF